MTDLPPLREVIARHGLAARRALGQHFLLDANLTQRIVRAAGPLAGRHVVEIGPGPGGLTRALLGSDAASVTVVEIDRRAVAAMQELAAAAGGRLRVVAGDALALDVAALVPAPRQVVANLPYNIATPLLIGWLRQASRVRAADADVPAGGGRTDLRRAGHRRRMDDCPYWRSGPAARSCCCAFRRRPSCRRPRCSRPSSAWCRMRTQPAPALFAADGAADRGGIRPAAQDAAWRAEAAWRRGVAASGGYRAGAAGGNAVGGRIRSAGPIDFVDLIPAAENTDTRPRPGRA